MKSLHQINVKMFHLHNQKRRKPSSGKSSTMIQKEYVIVLKSNLKSQIGLKVFICVLLFW